MHCNKLRYVNQCSSPPPKSVLLLTAVGKGTVKYTGWPGEAMPSEVKVKAEEPPRALREVDRLTRNPEKLSNAGGRYWKDTLRRKMSFKTYRSPHPVRRGLVTAWQKDQETLMKWNQTQIWATTSTDPGLDREIKSPPAGVEKTEPPRLPTCENPAKGEKIAYSAIKRKYA